MIKYSLIVATCGRYAELDALLHSLTLQTLAKEMFEVIIVDQNETTMLQPLVQRYMPLLNLIYIHSTRKGLSYNRNLGMREARGQYMAVPDDDCLYYPDTLEQVDRELKHHGSPDMLIGKVFDRETRNYVFKKTPTVPVTIHRGNFYTVVSSITLFFQKSDCIFDEDFGVGEKYHSNEDGELILHYLAESKRVIYSPLIDLYHPPYDGNTMPVQKLYNYGIGFGALCRKYFSLPLAWLFFKVCCFQAAMWVKEALCFNAVNVKRRRIALKGRLNGFFRYKTR